MRPSRRLLLSLRAISIFLLLAASHSAWAQAPASQASRLPPKWNDAVHALAEKIAAAAGSSHEIGLEVKNISSLDSSTAAEIRHTLESDLASRGIKSFSAGSPTRLTLSEGVQGYVWIVEYGQSGDKQVEILLVSRETIRSGDKENVSISLDMKLVWDQPGRFFDFAIFTRPVWSYSTIVILEPERLAYFLYRSTDSKWEFWKAIQIPHQGPWPRDLHGGINPYSNFEAPWLSGVQCSGDIEDPLKVECGPLKKNLIISRIKFDVPGHEQSEIATLSMRCGADSVLVASGSGDWTQPDTIQGFLLPDAKAQAIPSGSPLMVDGPVIDLQSQGTQSAARAVVRNLKTGNYEGYLVTATCSH